MNFNSFQFAKEKLILSSILFSFIYVLAYWSSFY